MLDFIEVSLAHPKQCSAVDLGISTHIIVEAGMEFSAISAVPSLLGLIGAFDKDGLGVPIGAAARQIVSAFQ